MGLQKRFHFAKNLRALTPGALEVVAVGLLDVAIFFAVSGKVFDEILRLPDPDHRIGVPVNDEQRYIDVFWLVKRSVGEERGAILDSYPVASVQIELVDAADRAFQIRDAREAHGALNALGEFERR